MQNNAPQAAEPQCRIIVASPEESDRAFLVSALRSTGIEVGSASTCRDVLRNLEDRPACAVVSETGLPDGDWKILFAHLLGLPRPPNLIVTSRTADDCLWAEVLNLGGYDVIAKPLDAGEVLRVVLSACRNHRQESLMAVAAGG